MSRPVRATLIAALPLLTSCYAMWRPAPDAAADAGPDVADADLDADASDASDAAQGPTFCDPELTDVGTAAIYADERGLYVLARRAYMLERRLYHHTADVWQTASVSQIDMQELAGREGGPLFELGPSNCGIRRIEGTTSSCSGAFFATHVHVVSADEAFAFFGGGLFRFDGSVWKTAGTLPSRIPAGAAYWTDGTTGLVDASDRILEFALDGSGSGVIPAPPSKAWPTAITRDESVDYWTASDRLFSREGSAWTARWTGACGGRPLVDADLGLFEGILYFWSETYVGRLDPSGPTMLLEWPCDSPKRIEDVHVHPEHGVVMVVSLVTPGPCGAVEVFRVDDGGSLQAL